MPNKNLICFVMTCIWCTSLFSQTTSWNNLKQVSTVPIKAQYIAPDKMGNWYAISGQEIIKMDSNGKILLKNSLKNMGNISEIDVSNPLKILVFYQELSKVVILDNMLANTGEIDLALLGYDQASLICTSHDNGYWIYNPLNFELLRLNAGLKMVQQSGNIAQLIGKSINPLQMLEVNNKLYLCDSTSGILTFDIFGAYIKTIPIQSITNFQVENNHIYYTKNKSFACFDPQYLKMTEIFFPEADFQQVKIQKSRVFVRLTDKIIVYENP